MKHTVLVDYDRRVEDGVKDGKYVWANPNITSNHFPSQETGAREVLIKLIHFRRSMDEGDVLRELDEQGLRPATLKELLSLGEKYPGVQHKFPIVALGSVCGRLPDGGRRCACLDMRGSARGLRLIWIGVRWHNNRCFAAVRLPDRQTGK